MKELGITKGEFKTMPAFCKVFGLKVWEVSNEDEWIAQIRGNGNQVEYNAKLTANAFNTAQKTNMFPSELLERYNEAIEVLKLAKQEINNNLNVTPRTNLMNKIEQTISKAKP